MSLHVFDLDHTLLIGNSSYRFGAYLYHQQFFSFSVLMKCLSSYVSHRYLGMSMPRLHDKIFSYLFQGRAIKEINDHLTHFLNHSLSSLIYKPAMRRLQEAQKRKETVFILSSSPDFLIQPIAKHFGVTNWRGTTYKVDGQGRLSSVTAVMEGEKKAKEIQAWIDQKNLSLRDVVAYSDSYLDLPLLNIVGTAVGVRPDRQLRRICIKKGWEIL